jgi:hypothetical protein
MLSSFIVFIKNPKLIRLTRHPNNNKLSGKPSSFCQVPVGKDLESKETILLILLVVIVPMQCKANYYSVTACIP